MNHATPDDIASKRLFLLPLDRNIRQILGTAPGWGVRRATARNNGLATTVDAAGWQAFAVDGLDKYACYLLRECAMFSRRTPPQRFFEFVGDIRTNKYTFTVCHI